MDLHDPNPIYDELVLKYASRGIDIVEQGTRPLWNYADANRRFYSEKGVIKPAPSRSKSQKRSGK